MAPCTLFVFICACRFFLYRWSVWIIPLLFNARSCHSLLRLAALWETFICLSLLDSCHLLLLWAPSSFWRWERVLCVNHPDTSWGSKMAVWWWIIPSSKFVRLFVFDSMRDCVCSSHAWDLDPQARCSLSSPFSQFIHWPVQQHGCLPVYRGAPKTNNNNNNNNLNLFNAFH